MRWPGALLPPLDPAAAAAKAEPGLGGRFVFAGPGAVAGLMRFEAEVEAGKGREVWAAVEELAAGYLREQVAASMGQARADAFVDLLLANAAVSTGVDIVRKRDLRCRFPGCGTPTRFCDLDHVIPDPLGRTVLANLACL